MDRTARFKLSGAVLGILLAFCVGVAVGQNAPMESKGTTTSAPTVINLSGQIEGVEGRQLRLRVITIDPGGVGAIHNHQGRPGMAYIAQGNLTEHRAGREAKDYRAGDVLVEDIATVHWAENKGSESVLIVAVDIFKP